MPVTIATLIAAPNCMRRRPKQPTRCSGSSRSLTASGNRRLDAAPSFEVLRDAGHAVIASDIHLYDFPLHFTQDFLTTTKAPERTEIILTNPPYRYAAEFVTQALKLCPRVILLCRLAFLESERLSPILDRGQLARIYVFRDRLPMMHRDGWAGPKASSAIAFAWLVWDANHTGPTTMDRISWRTT